MPNRKIHGKWTIDITYNRRRTRLRSPLNTRQGAELFEATLRQRLAMGLPLVDSEETNQIPSFAEYAQVWATNYAHGKNKPSEIHSKQKILRNHLVPAFGDTRLDAITPMNVSSLMATMRGKGLSAKYTNNVLTVLRRCLSCAKEDGIIEAVPTIKQLRYEQPEVEILNQDEAARLAAYDEDARAAAAIHLALGAGLRSGEILALQGQDIDYRERLITVRHNWWRGHLTTTKGDRTRQIPLSEPVERALRSVERRGDFLFANPVTSRPYSPKTMLAWLKRACQRTQVRVVGMHALRHTFASHLIALGVDILVVQRLLGHRDIRTTMRYLHLDKAQKRSALDRLAGAWSSPSADFSGTIRAPGAAQVTPSHQFAPHLSQQ